MLLRNQPLKVPTKIVYSAVGIALATMATTTSATAATITGSHVTTRTDTVTVSGKSNVWLSGMPAGSKAQGGDTTQKTSPYGISLLDNAVREFTFTNITGAVGNTKTGAQFGPEGSGYTVKHRNVPRTSSGAENGISDITAPQNGLIAVFLGPDQPNLTAAPSGLNFNSALRNQSEFSPLLKQVFFIGDGMTDAGQLQKFYAPEGATRLFIGTMDTFFWSDNTGSFSMTVNQRAVPEPATIIGTLAFGAMGGSTLLKRKKKPLAC